MSTALVAAEKVLFAAMRAIIATHGHDPDRDPRARLDPVALERRPAASSVALLLGSLLGAGLGLVLGTLVTPKRINIVFSLVFTPLLFTGCSQYPWPSLVALPLVPGGHRVQPDDLRQRGDARPRSSRSVPHITPWVCLVVLRRRR